MVRVQDIEVGAVYELPGKHGKLRPRRLTKYNPNGHWPGGSVTLVTLPGNGNVGGTEDVMSANRFCEIAIKRSTP